VSAFADDPTIGDNEIIWRRIHQSQVVEDNNLKRKRPSTGGFDNGRDIPLSVYIASQAQSPQVVMQGAKEKYLVALTVGFIRQLPLGIMCDSSSGGPGHVLLIGKKTKTMLNSMAKTATWVVPYAP